MRAFRPHVRFAIRPNLVSNRPRLSSIIKYTRNTTTQPHPSPASSSPRTSAFFLSPYSDPFINLAIEQLFFEHSPPEQVTLILYVNRPSVVIGRNQNPWREANRAHLAKGLPCRLRLQLDDGSTPEKPQPIDLVRRRSGGGTVYHEKGNVNWSVICPPAGFSRRTHAEMVVRALTTRMGIRGLEVNERHDIVQTLRGLTGALGVDGEGELVTRKVSGSAFKMTGKRAMHHGTALVASPNTHRIGEVLDGPAGWYVGDSRGVESVSSPVGNIGINERAFESAIRLEFMKMYGVGGGWREHGRLEPDELEQVKRYAESLRKQEWIYGETPRFTFSTKPRAKKNQPSLWQTVTQVVGSSSGFSEDLEPTVEFTARHGQILEASVKNMIYDVDGQYRFSGVQDVELSERLVGKYLYRMRWQDELPQWNEASRALAREMDIVVGVGIDASEIHLHKTWLS